MVDFEEEELTMPDWLWEIVREGSGIAAGIVDFANKEADKFVTASFEATRTAELDDVAREYMSKWRLLSGTEKKKAGLDSSSRPIDQYQRYPDGTVGDWYG